MTNADTMIKVIEISILLMMLSPAKKILNVIDAIILLAMLSTMVLVVVLVVKVVFPEYYDPYRFIQLYKRGCDDLVPKMM
jgi:hypothetical protein